MIKFTNFWNDQNFIMGMPNSTEEISNGSNAMYSSKVLGSNVNIVLYILKPRMISKYFFLNLN